MSILRRKVKVRMMVKCRWCRRLAKYLMDGIPDCGNHYTESSSIFAVAEIDKHGKVKENVGVGLIFGRRKHGR